MIEKIDIWKSDLGFAETVQDKLNELIDQVNKLTPCEHKMRGKVFGRDYNHVQTCGSCHVVLFDPQWESMSDD